MTREGFRSATAIGHVLAKPGERAPRTNHRIKQPTGRHAVAELQTIGDDVLHPEMLRQRPHHVVQGLAYQDDIRAGLHELLNLLHAALFQARPQFVLEVFFA